MKRIILLFAIIFITSSFSNKALNEYGKWIKFYNLKTEDFKQIGKELPIKFDWKQYDLASADKQLYDSLYFYSKDSTYFIDLYSYSIILERDSKGTLSWGAGDPESKVQLVKTKKLSATTLLFFGTDEYSETALWRTPTLLEVYGFKISNNIYTPTIWKYDLILKIFTTWENKKTFNSIPKSYLQKVILRNIKMKE